MKINLYRNESRHQRFYLDLFAQGLKKHGQAFKFKSLRRPDPCDLAVFWSAHFQHLISYQQQAGQDFLIMERGYFGNRMKMTSLGFNGLNGRAEFLNANSPADRWQKIGLVYADWKTRGDYILIMGQVMGDASIKNIDFIHWIRSAHYEMSLLYDLPIVCRPHPLQTADHRHAPCHDFANISTKPLAEDLKHAFCVVTFNSNSGVDAAMAGVPVIACDPGSMAWPIAAQKIREPLRRPSRKQWAHDLAYCQWSELELKDGIAWDHLKQKYEAT